MATRHLVRRTPCQPEPLPHRQCVQHPATTLATPHSSSSSSVHRRSLLPNVLRLPNLCSVRVQLPSGGYQLLLRMAAAAAAVVAVVAVVVMPTLMLESTHLPPVLPHPHRNGLLLLAVAEPSSGKTEGRLFTLALTAAAAVAPAGVLRGASSRASTAALPTRKKKREEEEA